MFVLCCSLLLRFTEDKFDPEQSATIGQINFSALFILQFLLCDAMLSGSFAD